MQFFIARSVKYKKAKWQKYRFSAFVGQHKDNIPGGLPFNSDGDALGVWDGKSLYLPIQVSLRTVRKEIYKKCRNTDHTEISLRDQFKLDPHPHWSPLGDEHPRHFYMEAPPPPPAPGDNIPK